MIPNYRSVVPHRPILPDSSPKQPRNTIARRVGTALALIAALVLAVRYTPLLDPDIQIAPKLSELAAQFHTGGGQCLRYHEGAPNAAEVMGAATLLTRAGVTPDDLSGLVGELYGRAREEEKAHHPLAEEDEWIAAIAQGSSPLRRLAIDLKRDRLRALLVDMLAVDVPKRKLLTDLKPGQRKAIDALWARDPSLFLVSNLIPLLAKLKQLYTTAHLDALAAALADQLKTGAAPATLEELGLDPQLLEDGWGQPIEYERAEGKLVLTSAGEGTPDTRTIPLPSTMPALPQATGCASPGEVEIKRKQFDDAITNPNSLALSARVTPAIQDGAVIGFKLFKIQPGSLYAAAGLCDGDVVKAVNGRALTSPDRALEVYTLAKTANEVSLAVRRGGADVTLTVHVR